jgi:hypothetical protein
VAAPLIAPLTAPFPLGLDDGSVIVKERKDERKVLRNEEAL